MRKKIALTAPLLLWATQYCHAQAYTLAQANTIIMILVFVVVLLLVLGVYGLRYNKIIHRRNEQLLRILNALDNYRAIVGEGTVSLDEQEELIKEQLPKAKTAQTALTDGSQTFFVKMDARVNKEKPFTDPAFDQQALAAFMDVDLETFRRLVPRYQEADRTLDYINSLRAEYAAKLLMEHSGRPIDDLPAMCGFTDVAAFNKAFKFAFGITPTDYLNSMTNMFKKK